MPPDTHVKFSVLQPGSAVATELSDVEAQPKSVAILHIDGEHWKLESLPLTTVRPYLTAEVVLQEHGDERDLHNEEGTPRARLCHTMAPLPRGVAQWRV